MLFNLLFESPELFITIILAIIYAITIHEFSHALAAESLGDGTAKFNGRLTLNPLSHLEFLGTLMLLMAGFGWGKPVPVNIYNLKWKKYGEMFVSLAGPLSNFLSVILFIILFKLFAINLPPNNLLFIFLSNLIIINLILGVFNLIPIPPLDGSKVLFAFLPSNFNEFKRKMIVNGPWILLILIISDNFLGFNIFGGIFNYFITLVNYFI